MPRVPIKYGISVDLSDTQAHEFERSKQILEQLRGVTSTLPQQVVAKELSGQTDEQLLEEAKRLAKEQAKQEGWYPKDLNQLTPEIKQRYKNIRAAKLLDLQIERDKNLEVVEESSAWDTIK